MEEKEKKKLLDKDDEKEILKCWANIVAKRAKEVGKELDRIGDSFQDYGARDSFQKELSRQKISDEKDLSVFADFICDRTWCASGMILKVGDFTHISIGACSAILFSDTSVMDYLFSLSRNNIDWQEIVNKILDQLEIILTFAKKIRRNILYPEVAEMELKITRLESENLHARESLERSYKHTKELLGEADKREDDLKSQLAEKEKKIEELRKKLRELQHWYEESKKYNNALIDAIEKAVIAIWNTKSIFGKFSSKSGTLARIREDLMKVLPVEIFFKLCRFMPYKNLPPTGPPNPRPKPPEDWRVKIGAEPKEKRPNPDIKPPTYDVVSEGYDPEAVKK